MGRIKNNNWRIDFDFLIKKDSIVKILEGNYDNRIEIKKSGIDIFNKLVEENKLKLFVADLKPNSPVNDTRIDPNKVPTNTDETALQKSKP